MDDEPDTAEGIAEYLHSEFPTADVRSLTSPQRAREVLLADEVDVVISDYRMPEMNGLELVASVREKSPRTRWILVTGNDEPGLETRALLSVDAFFTKPFHLGEFANAVREALTATR